MKIADYWRITTFRLVLLFGAIFLAAIIGLLSLVYWRTAGFMTHQIDLIIATEAASFASENAEDLPETLATYHTRDARHINLYGLFARDGRWITGNVVEMPSGLPLDGHVHVLTQYQLLGETEARPVPPARVLAESLPWGEVLLVGRDITQLQEIRRIIVIALLEAGSVITVMGLAAGFFLSLRPLRRVQAIRAASHRVAAGELHVRLPVTARHDELDMLAATVNTMLTEVERLLGEVKSVCDNIAHDLRTPMTRLRARLYRLQQEFLGDEHQQDMIEEALADTDAVLTRFKALLRISEIEDRQRREAFAPVALGDLLRQVHEAYQPLAEDQGKQLRLSLEREASVQADTGLLFEAIANLVDNAIKFSPAGQEVLLHLFLLDGEPCLDIIDHGPGIPAAEHDIVLQRFYRGEHATQLDGSGLGLSIVAAIVRLHGFTLQIRNAEPGTCMRLLLAVDPFAGERG